MSYHQIEEIQSRKSEKVALFLSIENAMGLIFGALPAYLITTALPFVLRLLIVLAAGTLGVLLTLDVGGMALYERLVWRARGFVRRRVQTTVITPAQLVGAAVTVRRDRPLAVGGPVQVRHERARIIVAQPRTAWERLPVPREDERTDTDTHEASNADLQTQ